MQLMRFGRRPTFELLDDRQLLTAVNTLITGSGIRFQAKVLAEHESGLLVESVGQGYSYDLHHVDGQLATQLATIGGFEDFVDHPARDVHAVGHYWVYFEPVKIPLGAEPDFDADPRYLASDGTLEGTFDVGELLPESHSIRFAAALGNLAMLQVETPDHRAELWAVDLRNRSAELVADLTPGSDSTEFGDFFVYDQRLYFTTRGEQTELWRTDGSDVERIEFAPSQNIELLFGFEDRIVFETTSEAEGGKLWTLDQANVAPELLLGYRGKLEVKADQSQLFFELVGGDHRQLWATDGLGKSSTVLLSEAGGEDFFQTSKFTYFVQDAALVRSDGTVDGTAKLLNGPFEFVDATNSFLLVRTETQLLSFRDDAETPVAIQPPFPLRELRLLVATDDAIYFQHRTSIAIDPDESARSQSLHQFWKTYGTQTGSGIAAEWFSPRIFDGGNPGTAGAWSLDDSIVFHAKYQSWNFAPDFTIIAGFADVELTAHAGGELEIELEDVRIVNSHRVYETVASEDLQLDASRSLTAPALQVSFDWDLDGDGEFDDAVGVHPIIASQRIVELWNGVPIEAVLRVSVQGVDSVTDRITINCSDCASSSTEDFPGDANLDGSVTFADFLILSKNFGKVDAAWADGDFDADEKVGFSDFLLLQENFGRRRV